MNEWRNGLSNKRGTLAMARLGNQPDSATAQFFINLKDNDFLDQPRDGAGYAVFGKVIGGMPVVDAIGNVPTTRVGGMDDVPRAEVRILSVKEISKTEARTFASQARLEAAKRRMAAAEAEFEAAKQELQAAEEAAKKDTEE